MRYNRGREMSSVIINTFTKKLNCIPKAMNYLIMFQMEAFNSVVSSGCYVVSSKLQGPNMQRGLKSAGNELFSHSCWEDESTLTALSISSTPPRV